MAVPNRTSLTLLERVAWPMYAVGVLMIAFPLVDFVTNVWPLQLGSVPWRYGAVGLFSGFLLTPYLGVAMIVSAAAVLGHRSVVRAVGVGALIAAVLLVAAIALFVLDVLQIRGNVEEDVRTGFDVGAVKALLKYAASAAVVSWLGVVAYRAARPGRGTGDDRRDDLPLVQRGPSQP